MADHQDFPGEDELRELASLMESELFPRPHSVANIQLDELEALMKVEFFSYQYVAIPPRSGLIRLLHLNCGSQFEPLTASLQFAPLIASTRYEALSYAWGDPSKTHSIGIGTERLYITKSLYEALHRLRSRDERRILWADAICINQQDNNEKSYQITLMAEIYSLATCVLCWLGNDTPRRDGATAIGILQKLNTAGPITDQRYLHSWVVNEGLPPYGDRRWESLDYFFKLPWFRRRWVIQEFVKGKEVRLLCGSSETDWNDVVLGAQRCYDSALLWWAIGESEERMPELMPAVKGLGALYILVNLKSMPGTISWYAKAMREIYEGRGATYETEEALGAETANAIKSMDPKKMEYLYRCGTNREKLARSGFIKESSAIIGGKMSICNLLQICGGHSATDPRDCVFALLGLAEEADHPMLKPDYTQDTRTVYTRYAQSLIEQKDPINSVITLLYAGIGRYASSVRMPSLPSWVPDWSKLDTTKPTPLLARLGLSCLRYRAGGRRNLRLRVNKDSPDRLYLRGGFISSLIRIVPSPSFIHTESGHIWPEPQRTTLMRHYFAEVDKVVLNRNRPYPYPVAPSSCIHAPKSTEHDLEILWRTLIGNAIEGARAPKEETEASFLDFRMTTGLPTTAAQRMRAMLGKKHAQSFPGVDMYSWYAQWFKTVNYYSFAELSNGMFALIPDGSRRGDEVFVPLGCGVPLVLRRTQQAADATGAFHLVGGGYVHGIMEGEAFRMQEWKEDEICLV